MGDSKKLYLELKTFVERAVVYPPAEIFFDTYGKAAKREKAVQELCESVYRFSFGVDKPNPIGELRSAFRDLECLYLLGFDCVKAEQIQKYTNAFLEAAKFAIQEMDVLFKKDMALQAYYKGFAVKYQVLKSTVYDFTNSNGW